MAQASENGDFAGGNTIFYTLSLAAGVAGVILIASNHVITADGSMRNGSKIDDPRIVSMLTTTP